MYSIFMPLFDDLWGGGLFVKNNEIWDTNATVMFIGFTLAIMAVAYICGSVNTAILVTRFIYKEDIRTKGSGNPGMTNVMRNYGWLPALITLLGDMFKCIIGMMVGTLLLGITGAYIGGLFGIIGHVAPIFYKFKGGKGVASTFMFILYVDSVAFLVIGALFILLVWATKYLSLGSVICALAMPLILNKLDLMGGYIFVRLLIAFVIAGIVVYKHRANISRIMDKTENKFSFKKTKRKSESELIEEKMRENEPEIIEEELTPEVLARKEANRKKSAKKKK